MSFPYVRFKGGKGVATAAGMFLALAPLAIAVSIAIWCGVLWVSGYVSVASIVRGRPVPGVGASHAAGRSIHGSGRASCWRC